MKNSPDPKVDLFNAVRIERKTGVRTFYRRNMTVEEASKYKLTFPESNDTFMYVFFKVGR